MLGFILGLIAAWMWFVLVFFKPTSSILCSWVLIPVLMPFVTLIDIVRMFSDKFSDVIKAFAQKCTDLEYEFTNTLKGNK